MTTATDLWNRIRARRWSGAFASGSTIELRDEAPLRAELFSLQQLRSHAVTLAHSHEVDPRPGRERLLERLQENERIIRASHQVIAGAVAKGREIAPAAEWLLDNFYLIEDQIAIAREHLPSGYSRQLPRLRGGDSQGLPRVYDLVLELVSHTDGQVDWENLAAFVGAYQTVRPLNLGELWAVPIMLRLTLLENLRRASQRMAQRRRDRDMALEAARRFLEVADQSPQDIITELADFVRLKPRMSMAFIAEFVADLQGRHAGLGLVILWVEQQLAEAGQTIEQVQQAESRDQAADQVSVGNSVTSLRRMGSIEWNRFVEDLSVTEAALRRDPSTFYGRMDFATRDHYRHVVETLSRRCSLSEQDIAAKAVALATERLAALKQAAPSGDRRETHVGFFLVDRGLRELEAAVGYRVPLYRRVGRVLGRRPARSYALIILVLTAALAVLPPTCTAEGTPAAVLAVLFALVAAVVSSPAIRLVHWVATLLRPPRRLPRLDFAAGVPPEHRTVVVVPSMLTSASAVRGLVEDLELRYLGNRTSNLFFALLTDFMDAGREHMPEDEALLAEAERGIAELNMRYAPEGQSLFYLFHRPRRWNEAEGVWMGHERKRGKLHDFNQFLLNGRTDPFLRIVGDVDPLRSVRYVITLDTDTQLPPGSAAKLIGTIAHPLNRPIVNPRTRCVEQGFGVLQPRVAISLDAARRSLFARLFAGEVGIDPYTRAVSHVYQDLFGRAQFIGKGIYDLHAFEAAVGERFPENAILSHDLIEGCHARCGFINDVELIEDHPSRYLADVNRRSRWVRGDWQIAAWLLPRVPGHRGRRIPNPLDGLSRWLIADNLRRSMVPAVLLATLAIGWLLPWVHHDRWMAVLLGVWFMPDVLRTVRSTLARPHKIPWDVHLRAVVADEARQWVVDVLPFVFLPYEGLVNVGAIARVGWRKLISHKKLLEWQTSHDADRSARIGLPSMIKEMWVAPMTGILMGAVLAAWRLEALPTALPLLLPWVVSPFLAWFISRPIRSRKRRLHPHQQAFLRRLARRTWAYFEAFATAEQNWLAPDNYREAPYAQLAERTSPTNIGMGVLGALAAHDFGYLSGGELVRRVEATFDSLEKLPRYRGHFYNWYGTRDARPLSPMYVSSVDSGNLAASLIVLRGGLLEMVDRPVLPARWREGLVDTGDLLREEIVTTAETLESTAERSGLDAVWTALAPALDDIRQAPDDVGAIAAALDRLLARLEEVGSALSPHQEPSFWHQNLTRQCRGLREDVSAMAPWVDDPMWRAQVSQEHPERRVLEPVFGELARVPTLRALAGAEQRLRETLGRTDEGGLAATPSTGAVSRVVELVRRASAFASDRILRIESLVQRAGEMADLDLDFLYNRSRKLLSIGFSIDGHRPDPGDYDLLASEARLCSYMGIAQGRLPQEHWFLLGRAPTSGYGPLSLLSWSGSMFEYLMPLLVMPTYEGTLLHEVCRGAVRRQIRYGRRLGLPWGMSESCYNLVDRQMTYQYRAFGVPDLGLKRGLADDRVVAPYASALALMVLPREACANLERMSREGFVGRYGLYEAVDYTPSRVPTGQSRAVVKCYMAHHGGMVLLSLAHALLDQPMQRRFLMDPEMRSAVVLLHERVPRARGPERLHSAQLPVPELGEKAIAAEAVTREYRVADLPVPEVHLLSNGRYSVGVSHVGGGFSRWNGLALTRWREDVTRDAWGTFFYIRDVDQGSFWSTTYQPVCRKLARYEAVFSQGQAEFRAAQDELQVHTRIAVSPEDDIELRRMTISNPTNRKRTVELTSYAEPVLMDPRAEEAHPVFNNLFVETDVVKDRTALLCTRRARSIDENPPWMFHTLIVHGPEAGTGPMGAKAILGEVSFETHRPTWVGRNRTLAHPAAMDHPGPLSNTAGSVLDPVLSIRRRFTLGPGTSLTVDAIMGGSLTRDQAVLQVERYHDRRLADRVFEIAWTQSQVLQHQLRITESDAVLFGRLAASLVYANPRHRAGSSVIARNRRGQSALWVYGVSGDLPIALVHVTEPKGLELVRRALQAHAYWRHKGLRTDLFIWCDAFSGYRQALLDQVMGEVNAGPEMKVLDQPGGVFVRSTDQLPDEDRRLLQAVARVFLSDRAGSLTDQIDRRGRPEVRTAPLARTRRPQAPLPSEMELPPRDLRFFNGLGGFTPDGREYVVVLRPGTTTPAPWVNVLANPDFGAVVSETGGGYTWFMNAHEYRLTPWYNDPATDMAGEAFYLRDEETGEFWSLTPQPARGHTHYVCRHGLGYSAFENAQRGLFTELITTVGVDAPVRLWILTVRNTTERTVRVSATGFVEWVLGDMRDKHAPHIVTHIDPQSGAILASNAYASDFPDKVVFFQCSEPDRSLTADRTEFIGRNNSLRDPAALHRRELSSRVGAGLDPCGAIQGYLDLPPGEQRQIVFTLGAGHNESHVRELLGRFAGTGGARQALEAVWEHWKHVLGGVYVETPDESVNFMANHWLPYQVLACRFWGRSGYYQSAGAFGFRDQLQDAMAFAHECPWLLRQHLLTAAGRQFREGDVQHWWHPPTGRGVRTHFSDDFLWLPLATCRYVKIVGDTGVLDEKVPFLEGRQPRADEESVYDLPSVAEEQGTLYEHCVRAVRRGLRFGPHGLPLMGCGDWNDGMNRVGIKGTGESVWLAFFLYHVLKEFADLARRKDDQALADECQEWACTLRDNIEAHGWDGRWYRRAYFDDGEPLGSGQNSECRIDVLPQAWSVLSRAGDPGRARMAMQAVLEHLVDPSLRLIRLLDPPFEGRTCDPGYIRGYPPGVRENGGQYTHAAVWAAMAFADLGDAEQAWRLFDLINPVRHGDTPEHVNAYKVEPYVVAADVYTLKGHEGRGGWTWYTGSASWMYRLLQESLLGIRREADILRIEPLLPPTWQQFRVHYRFHGTMYHIEVIVEGPNTRTVRRVTVDGEDVPDLGIHMVDDHLEHAVQVTVG